MDKKPDLDQRHSIRSPAPPTAIPQEARAESSNNTVLINLRPHTLKLLETQAKAGGPSVSKFIEDLVESAVHPADGAPLVPGRTAQGSFGKP